MGKLTADYWHLVLISPQVHIFPEGKVNQPNLHPPGGMRRFKWGM